MKHKYVFALVVMLLTVPASAADRPSMNWLDSCLAAADAPVAPAAGDVTISTGPFGQKISRDNYPLPGHTFEGVGGGMYVPSAYLVNPGPADQPFGMPSVSARVTSLRHQKSLFTIAITETLFGRIELGYALNELDTGTLERNTKAAFGVGGGSIGHHLVYVHNFSARAQVIEEDSFDMPLPAVTVGALFKYNDSVRSINGRLGVPLDPFGYERSSGVIFTIHASKRIELADLFSIERLPPVIVTAGVRNSEAMYNGFMGFTDHRTTTFEASVTTFLAEWIAVSYEFKRNQKSFSTLPAIAQPVMQGEENWHAIGVSCIVSENLSINAGVGFLGNMANTESDGAYGFQAKWEF